MLLKNYELETYRNTKILYPCPACKQGNSLQRFIYKQSRVQVADEVGECKAKNCGYKYHPLTYFTDTKTLPVPLGALSGPSFIDAKILNGSLKNYEENNFTCFLSKLFGEVESRRLVDQYSIGTSKRVTGSTVFWLIDREEKIRTGRIINFNKQTGYPLHHIPGGNTWVHTSLKVQRFNAVPCLFGEHLLKNNELKPVVITESESTAVIASGLYPGYIWLSTCGFPAPSKSMVRVLSNRSVIWYPQTGFDKLNQFSILEDHAPK